MSIFLGETQKDLTFEKAYLGDVLKYQKGAPILFSGNYYSKDGVNWELMLNPSTYTSGPQDIYPLSKGLIGMTIGLKEIYVSSDLIGWSLVKSYSAVTAPQRVCKIADDKYYGVFKQSGLYTCTSTDGINWTATKWTTQSPSFFNLYLFGDKIILTSSFGLYYKLTTDELSSSLQACHFTRLDGSTFNSGYTIANNNPNFYGICKANNFLYAISNQSNSASTYPTYSSIWRTTDGINWIEIYTHQLVLYDITYNKGKFVCCGSSSKGIVSSNGTTWSEIILPSYSTSKPSSFGNIENIKGIFFTCGNGQISSSYTTGGYSADGTSWTKKSPPSNSLTLRNIKKGKASIDKKEYLFIGGDSGYLSYTSNGSDWGKIQDTVTTNYPVYDVTTIENNLLVTTSYNKTYSKYPLRFMGGNWTNMSLYSKIAYTNTIDHLISIGEKFLGFREGASDTQYLIYSPNNSSAMSQITVANTYRIKKLLNYKNGYIAIHQNGAFYGDYNSDVPTYNSATFTDLDGSSFTSKTDLFNYTHNALIEENGDIYVVSGSESNHSIYKSSDGINYTQIYHDENTSVEWQGIAKVGNLYGILAGKKFLISENLETAWTVTTYTTRGGSILTETVESINNLFLIENNDYVYTSPDGVNWTEKYLGSGLGGHGIRKLYCGKELVT